MVVQVDSRAVLPVSNGYHEACMTTLVARRSICCTSALCRVIMQGTLPSSRNLKVRAYKKKQPGMAFPFHSVSETRWTSANASLGS